MPAETASDTLEIAVPLVGYSLSVTLSIILVVLVWRSPGPGRAGRSIFAVAAAYCSLGGLMRALLMVGSDGSHATLMAVMNCVSFIGAAIWPIGFSMLWAANDELTAVEKRQQQRLVVGATASATVLSGVLLWAQFVDDSLLSVPSVRMLIGYNVVAFMLVGLWLMRGHSRTLPERLGIGLMLLGPLLTLGAHVVSDAALLPSRWDALIVLVGKQSLSLSILGGLFFLGRFRASDRFARLSLRVLVGTMATVMLASVVVGPLTEISTRARYPGLILFVGVSLAIILAAVLLGRLGSLSDRWVSLHVFGEVDPGVALRHLREETWKSESVSAVLSLAEEFVLKTLRLQARVVPANDELPGGSYTVPVQVGAVTVYQLAILGLEGWRSLMSGEIELLSMATDIIGRRLEAFDRENERLERSRREASLVNQLIEAELRALRAQVNPHFLFNSLNTIAALVHQQPSVAEAMTLSLAKIFRRALSQETQPYSSLAEELQFLKAYLDIEQIRFGDRLQVEFQVLESIQRSSVPSLILQPLVENAIKHGLAPKIGECHLLIGGSLEGERLVLRVEDNGVGVASDPASPSTGIGLRNVRERLRGLYGERAQLRFESVPDAGSRATLYLPLMSV